MGMAASQARLLTITARLADNELRSQTINNAKMRLATQSSQASETYINALNDATLKFSNYDESGNEMSQTLTFNALTAYSSYNTQYGLVNSSGQILVSESEAAMFEKANGNLTAYLDAHGLEYTTTYFDELGTLENDAYPVPFNSIEPDTLQSYYEQYSSYQNSAEVENYEKNYSEYNNTYSELVTASEDAIQSYLTKNNTSSVTYDSSADSYGFNFTDTSTAAAMLNEIKNAFTGTSSPASDNTFNINNLLSAGFISQVTADEVTDELDKYSTFNGTLPAASGDTTTYSGLKYTNEVSDFSYDESTKTYTVDGCKITVDESGMVINFDTSGVVADTGQTITYTSGAVDGTLSFEDFINNLSYKSDVTNDDGTVSTHYYDYEVEKNAAGEIIGINSSAYLTDNAEIQSELSNIADIVIPYIISSVNYENFADFLTTHDSADLLNTYGINTSATIGSSSKTLQNYIDAFKDAKSIFLSSIFDSSSVAQVEDDIRNNYSFTNDLGETVAVTAENLSDIDFVLQYLKHRGLTQSESFNTVIKQYLIDNMIAEYGEPKYAWIDENDTGNTGNADAKAQWYTNLFNRMLKGYKVLENGLASSSEWIEYALENGIVSMEQVDKSYNWDGLDYKTCTKITEETSNDAVTKAEAEYNKAMNDIEAKDNIYDVELKNIDTEHSSLQTEYESIKSVITKNIERTFKFNQSA